MLPWCYSYVQENLNNVAKVKFGFVLLPVGLTRHACSALDGCSTILVSLTQNAVTFDNADLSTEKRFNYLQAFQNDLHPALPPSRLDVVKNGSQTSLNRFSSQGSLGSQMSLNKTGKSERGADDEDDTSDFE